MEDITEKEKSTLALKLLSFQKSGLESYGKYLNDQLEYATKSDNRKAYKKYIESQISMNIEKIKNIEEKI